MLAYSLNSGEFSYGEMLAGAVRSGELSYGEMLAYSLSSGELPRSGVAEFARIQGTRYSGPV